jgi:hypothetical protein
MAVKIIRGPMFENHQAQMLGKYFYKKEIEGEHTS